MTHTERYLSILAKMPELPPVPTWREPQEFRIRCFKRPVMTALKARYPGHVSLGGFVTHNQVTAELYRLMLTHGLIDKFGDAVLSQRAQAEVKNSQKCRQA